MLKEGGALFLCISVCEPPERSTGKSICTTSAAAWPVTPDLRQYSPRGLCDEPVQRRVRSNLPVPDGGQYTIFRFFRLYGRMPQSLLLALACSVCDNRHTQVAVVNAPLFVPCCALFAETWVFLLGFITLLSRFRHLICSALRKVTVKNFFNE